MSIHKFAGKEWTQCDNCGDLISGTMPTKEDVQKHPMQGGIVLTVYDMCKICQSHMPKSNIKIVPLDLSNTTFNITEDE